MDPRHAVLFEPIKLGPKIMPNRFCQVPHCTGFGVSKPMAQAHHRAVKAEGGWGAVFTEECSVHWEGDSSPNVLARLWDDDDAANLSLMCDMAHEQKALAGIELWYGGSNPNNVESRAVSRAASQIASDMSPMAPALEMDLSDIELVQGFYVTAAERARDAGFDIVCLYGGHEALLEQFFSPYYNKRSDAYGGSSENRSRMFRETIQRVSAAVGGDCAISVRLSADTLRGEEGVQLERDVLPFVAQCDEWVDLWDVHIGGFDWGEDAVPSRFLSSDRHHRWVKAVKQATTKPVVACGRFTDPTAMVRAIEDGVLDVIGAARPTIADPFLPTKIAEGRIEDICECIGCNMCVARFESGGAPIICTQNPTCGEEYRRGWHPERFSRASNFDSGVLIVGAGPAGMECARVLGERGMRDVHLIDAGPRPGGHLEWLTRLPGLGQWRRVAEYRQTQIDKLRNITFIPKRRLSAEEVLDYGADIVIVATGARWATNGLGAVTTDGIPGADATLPHILTPEQILADGKEPPGDQIVIVDEEGYHIGVALADLLSAAGKQVTILTSLGELAPYTHLTLESAFFRRKLHAQGVKVVPSMIPVRCTPRGVEARYAYAPDGETEVFAADACVLVTQRCSDVSLYRALIDDIGSKALAAEGIRQVFRIGDCVAPRVIADCVFDGHRLAREIDTDDPAMPLPYLRERPVVLGGA